ncbi:MAG: hypothetical protein FJW23_00545 [Acidimicrobiia bacterium]|nr:hypothetical protein [Acidimicrobiia bacterium]
MSARAATITSVVAALAVASCGGLYEISIETPIRPKLDVSAFQRVLVAGFVAGGSQDVDANQETVRLLRSQLRSKSQLRVIDADSVGLLAASAPEPERTGGSDNAVFDDPALADTTEFRDEEDLEPYEHIFADVEYWKKLGEEHQGPLIVTGTVLFTPRQASGYVQREEEVYDAFGRRRVVPIRTYQERKGFVLRPKFIFIDGRTGTTLYSESFHEEVLYPANQTTPALSSYFELMERLIPSFLNTLSSQKIRGTRILLK